MPFSIPFNFGSSRFISVVESAIREQRDQVDRGRVVSAQFDESATGYEGKHVVRILKEDANHFRTEVRFLDVTRFPARIRAAATALKNLGLRGEYQIAHKDGTLTIQKLLKWEFLQREFHAEQTYLARKNGRIVCCTLRPEDNIGAPGVIMVGDRPRNMEVGEVLCGQLEAFPVFLKRGVDRWEYQGEFCYESDTKDPQELAKAIGFVNRPVTHIIYLRPANAALMPVAASELDSTLDVVSVVGRLR